MLFACCTCLVFSSCSIDDNEVPVNPPSPPSDDPIDPVKCTAKVDFGDISGLPADLQAAMKKRFPNLTSDGDADICFCQTSEVEKFTKRLEIGSTTIVVTPTSGADMSNIIKISGGVVPKETALPILFYATQKYGQHYVMLEMAAPPTSWRPNRKECSSMSDASSHWFTG